MIFATAALAVVLATLPASAPPKLPAVPPVTLTGAWTSIPLPAAPLGIAVHNGTIWVCGWNEMIAESTDGGRNWTVRNLHPKRGALLFSFAFYGHGRMAVFGSYGVWLDSSDEGQTWRVRQYFPAGGLTRVRFVDAKHAFGMNADQFAWTDDGGSEWSHASNGVLPIVDFAALSSKQAAFLFMADPSGVQTLLYTRNGGKDWLRAVFPSSWHWLGLYAGATRFHLLGEQQRGNRAMYVTASSADGAAWHVDAPTAGRLYRCNRQGCMAGDGHAWAAFPSLSQFIEVPEDQEEPLTGGWAADGETLCRVSAHLRCRVGLEPAGGSPTAEPPDIAVRCLKCPAPFYTILSAIPTPGTDLGLQVGGVVADAMIGRDGKVREVILRSAFEADAADACLAAIRKWQYLPPTLGGKPSPAFVEITVTFSPHRR